MIRKRQVLRIDFARNSLLVATRVSCRNVEPAPGKMRRPMMRARGTLSELKAVADAT
jgi:hypothetical protein